MGQVHLPLVSIVVPTCDRSEMTRRCVLALLAQTYQNLEIIVVDDGSRDDTPSMLASLVTEHPEARLLTLRNASNLGANASRNRGVQSASGEFVAFLDSDCIAEPDWVEHLVNAFESEDVVAVTGLVEDPSPRSIYDLTFRGTHRVAGPGPARRLVAGNLCVRRASLLECTWYEDGELPPPMDNGQPDVSFSGACDEEGLALAFKARGWKMLACPKAVVLHEHYYDRRSFFRQAYHGGRAAAELVRRYRLPHRLDMAPFMLAYGSLPVALALVPWLGWWTLVMPVIALGLGLAAITYNDLFLKGKSLVQTALSYPMLLAYYHVRLFGYVQMTSSLMLGTSSTRRATLRPRTTEG